MYKLLIVSFLFLLTNFGFAQTDTLELLKGEWYYSGESQPEVNDSFQLSREKIYDIYVKWDFRENGSYTIQGITECSQEGNSGESMVILSLNASSIWEYNKDNQVIEIRDFSEEYRITGINENFLELLRLK